MRPGKLFVVTIRGTHFGDLGLVGVYDTLEKSVEGIKIHEDKIKADSPWFRKTTDLSIRESEVNVEECRTICRLDGSAYVIRKAFLNCTLPYKKVSKTISAQPSKSAKFPKTP